MADLTEQEIDEIAEGIRELRWFQKNGHKLIEAMLNPTWPPKKQSEVENGK